LGRSHSKRGCQNQKAVGDKEGLGRTSISGAIAGQAMRGKINIWDDVKKKGKAVEERGGGGGIKNHTKLDGHRKI